MERRPHTRGIAVKVQKPKKKPIWQCSDSSASETELDHEEKGTSKQGSSNSLRSRGKDLTSKSQNPSSRFWKAKDSTTQVLDTFAEVTERLKSQPEKHQVAMAPRLKLEESMDEDAAFISKGAKVLLDVSDTYEDEDLSDISDEALEELRQEVFDHHDCDVTSETRGHDGRAEDHSDPEEDEEDYKRAPIPAKYRQLLPDPRSTNAPGSGPIQAEPITRTTVPSSRMISSRATKRTRSTVQKAQPIPRPKVELTPGAPYPNIKPLVPEMRPYERPKKDDEIVSVAADGSITRRHLYGPVRACQLGVEMVGGKEHLVYRD